MMEDWDILIIHICMLFFVFVSIFLFKIIYLFTQKSLVSSVDKHGTIAVAKPSQFCWQARNYSGS